ncbi:hypothetical protein EDB89DRAFT_1058342 [Lactarius sanguifluus]|nr:hypothetical protein EDB89DRAFT_1058342 [Lactarius sanguifluus]
MITFIGKDTIVVLRIMLPSPPTPVIVAAVVTIVPAVVTTARPCYHRRCHCRCRVVAAAPVCCHCSCSFCRRRCCCRCHSRQSGSRIDVVDSGSHGLRLACGGMPQSLLAPSVVIAAATIVVVTAIVVNCALEGVDSGLEVIAIVAVVGAMSAERLSLLSSRRCVIRCCCCRRRRTRLVDEISPIIVVVIWLCI